MTNPIKGVNEVEVAYLPMNLQFFAEEAEGVVDLEENDTFNDSMRGEDDTEEQTEEVTEQTEEAESAEVVEPQDDKTNAAFAEMRRKTEALEKKTQQMDKWVADSYGESHGLKTWEDYQGALAEQAQEAERQRLLDKGVDSDVINEAVNNHPFFIAAKKEKEDRFLFENYSELQSEYPELVKSEMDIQPEVWGMWNNGENGMSLADAYTAINRKSIMQKTQASTKQKTLNNLNSKSHLSTEGDGAGEVTDVSIPADTLQMYLDQGYSKAEATKFHKKLYS